MTDPDLPTRTEGEGETLDMPEGMRGFVPGQVLGERYQVVEMLGRGGMGEVWHAFDLKLRVEVALKALRPEFFKSERRLELLRQEVRAAREVVSPNVCRIFDLIEVEGRELVSMEYVDGATLLGVLQERGPLELKEAQDIASQFLAGLEAIHKAGLIHRDIKPENIMLTRAGRVVVMDFGLARQEAEGGGSVSGTPAYMAPEQAAGQTLDARADVYAAGVVLAEMVSPDGIKSYQSRQSVWEGVRSEPAKVPETPWAAVIKKAVAKDREGRYHSAHTLTRALEDVTLRVEGAEDLHPYPGLASFTEEDAEYFFGREAEVEQMWRKLEGPARMLALVGPSGAGKTSFLNAGLIPAARAGWAVIRCTPGTSPMSALREALASEMSGDAEAMKDLVRTDDPSATASAAARWRQGTDHALLIVDQFEELVTLNAEEDQVRFASLLHNLVLQADISVLLSMRDDFLMACHRHETLRSVVADLTLLHAPTGAALRRALTQPALQCGYRFEDDELVDQMLAEVEGERGALPLLAFAAARLWEKRDRETGLLTRQAYRDIGGVGGALARHAEATIDQIGHERLPIVRELFRNLVTAEGTRAVREWNELLSVFCDSSDESQAVLRSLIDARLLTSYEVREEDREPTRRVEIIHESLLANWPRLVRWQTQDADAAQLRDQLRQAAKIWDEHGRHDDRLWTGTAYREYQLWRERYPGGLSELEEHFERAMIGHARRRKRRRRIAVAAVFFILLAVLAVLGTSRRQAIAEARRAEASKLVALAHVELATDPTQALAYATASLEVADSSAARSMVMQALWQGPPVRVFVAHAHYVRFSPEGGWIATTAFGSEAGVWSKEGEGPIELYGLEATTKRNTSQWSSESLLLTGFIPAERLQLWSIPEARLVRTIELGAPSFWQVEGGHLYAETFMNGPAGAGEAVLRYWRLPVGGPEELGRVDRTALGIGTNRWYTIFHPSGEAWLYGRDHTISARPLPIAADDADRVIGTHDGDDVWFVSNHSKGDNLVSCDGTTGELRVWSLSDSDPGPRRVIPRPRTAPESSLLFPDPRMRWLYRGAAWQTGMGLLWDLNGLPGAEPLQLRRSGSWQLSYWDFDPEGDWLAATTHAGEQVAFWPLHKAYPSIVKGESSIRKGLAFSPDGRWLATVWPQRRARLFPLPHTERTEPPQLARHSLFSNLAFDPTGAWLAGGGYPDSLMIVPLDGGPPRRLEGFQSDVLIEAVEFSPSGRVVAAASGISFEEKRLRVWNLDTGATQSFELPRADTSTITRYKGYLDNVQNLWFTDESTLVTVGATHFLRWDLNDGSYETVLPVDPVMYREAAASQDGQRVLMLEVPFDGSDEDVCETPTLYDLAAGSFRELPQFGDCVRAMALDTTGTVAVTGDNSGFIRVGRLDGAAPHLLTGHDGAVEYVAISSDLRWVASVGADTTVRLWPMPDLSKPPLHTLPHDELIAKLKSLTNLRAVRDEESSTGWKIEVGPFPGWAEVPEW